MSGAGNVFNVRGSGGLQESELQRSRSSLRQGRADSEQDEERKRADKNHRAEMSAETKHWGPIPYLTSRPVLDEPLFCCGKQ